MLKFEQQRFFFQVKGKTDWTKRKSCSPQSQVWKSPALSLLRKHHVGKYYFAPQQSSQMGLSRGHCVVRWQFQPHLPCKAEREPMHHPSMMTKVRMNYFFPYLCIYNNYCKVPNKVTDILLLCDIDCSLLIIHFQEWPVHQALLKIFMRKLVAPTLLINKYKMGNRVYFLLLRTDSTWESDPILKLQYRLQHIW